MTGTIHITDLSASDALRKYAGAEAFRGKGMADTLRKVMRFWVSFAASKIPKGNQEKILSDLRSLANTYSRIGKKRGKTADAWRGTIAAKAIAVIDWEGARKLTGAAFYAKARQFAAKRRFAANFHRAGFLPAFRKLKGRQGDVGRLPQFTNSPGQPGGIDENLTNTIADILVENWARSGGKKSSGMGDVINGVDTGAAFSAAFQQVEALLLKYYDEDIKKQAEKVGLTVA